MLDDSPDRPVPASVDVLVVGSGPAGSAAAAWAAEAGRNVLLVDSRVFPRDKTCGDGLTPRAVAELQRLKLTDWLDAHHRSRGVRISAWGRDRTIDWPAGGFPGYSTAVARTELDDRIRHRAIECGAVAIDDTRAVAVDVGSDGRLASVTLRQRGSERVVSAEHVVVADGVRSPIGTMLGRQWHRETVYGTAMRAYLRVREPLPAMVTHLGLTDAEDRPVPGYGWMFPLGDSVGAASFDEPHCLLNVGVGVFSTAARPSGMALRPLLDRYVQQVSDEAGAVGAVKSPRSALLPLGGAVSGVAGPNWVLVGDAAGCVNPLTGEGIDYALETGRLAAEMISGAAERSDFTQAWPDLLESRYGQMFSASRRLATMFFHPVGLGAVGRTVLAGRWSSGTTLRMMANLLADGDTDAVASFARGVGSLSLRFDDRRPFH